MKKNRVAFILFLILAIITTYFIFTNKGSTISEELRDFTIADTGSVDRIFIADKAGNKVLLERKSATDWTVNGNDNVRPDAINLLLKTLKIIEVRSPVGKAARNNIIKSMSSSGVKVEIYQNSKLTKTFYVGGATQDQMGTYMYLENSAVPFIMHIPGFDGYLTPRFIVNPADWKQKTVFAYKRGDLQSVVVQNIKTPAQSFEFKKVNDFVYGLFTYPAGQQVNYPDTTLIQNYLSHYQNINYEKLLVSMEKHALDSVLSAGPVMIIKTTHTNGTSTTAELFIKPADGNFSPNYDEKGKLLPFDPDRMICRLNKDTTLLLVQYFSFDKLMTTLDDLKNPVKKRN